MVVSIAANHQRRHIQLFVRTWDGVPAWEGGRWKWEGFEVSPHPINDP